MIRSLPISLLMTTAILAVTAPASNAATGGGSAGKVHYSDLSVMISLEKSTPLLDLARAEGKPIDALELTFRAPARGGEQQDYYTVTLENVLVSSYNTSATEIRLSISFAKSTHNGTGKTMSAEVLASLGHPIGANYLFADGSVRSFG